MGMWRCFGADVNAKISAFPSAVVTSHGDVSELVGVTPILLAVDKMNTLVAAALTLSGADWSIADKRGGTPATRATRTRANSATRGGGVRASGGTTAQREGSFEGRPAAMAMGFGNAHIYHFFASVLPDLARCCQSSSVERQR